MSKYIKFRGALYRRADKMDDLDLPAYLQELPEDWREILSRFPEGLVREFLTEFSPLDYYRVHRIANWTLLHPRPVAVPLQLLLRHQGNVDLVERLPGDDLEGIAQHYGVELHEALRYPDSAVQRYRDFAQQPRETAKPSVTLDGRVVMGVGRFLAALLRRDPSVKVWMLRAG